MSRIITDVNKTNFIFLDDGLRLRNQQSVVLKFAQHDLRRTVSRHMSQFATYSRPSPGAPWKVRFMGKNYYMRKRFVDAIEEMRRKTIVETGLMYHGPAEKTNGKAG